MQGEPADRWVAEASCGSWEILATPVGNGAVQEYRKEENDP